MFLAHKNGVSQVLPTPVADNPVSFGATLFNVGPYYDSATGRFKPPSGIYAIGASLNIVDPQDGGKYYTVIRQNGLQFNLLNPSRMSGAQDTVGTQVHGVVACDGNQYFEVVCQHSNDSGTKTIDGQQASSWFYAYRVGDYAGPAIYDKIGTTGPVTSGVAAGSYTYVDLSQKLIAGKTIAALGMLTTAPGSYPLKIVRRDGPGNYAVISSQNITHGGTGFEDLAIPPWTVPADGHDYYLGAFTTGANHPMFDGWPRAFAPSDIAGIGVSMIEDGAALGHYILGMRASYQP